MEASTPTLTFTVLAPIVCVPILQQFLEKC